MAELRARAVAPPATLLLMLQRMRTPVLLFCVLVTLLAAITPIGRVLRRTELSYNEGWNIAGAMRLSHGAASDPQLPCTTGTAPLQGGCCQTALYPAAWGWTTVNYPVLSFALMAGLHRFTGDYLFTARIVSLLALLLCSLLLAAVAHALGASRRATLLTGLLCAAVFCVCAIDYAGVDDPQLLGNALFLAALLVYVRGARNADGQPSYATVAVTGGLFVIAGCIKQSPIDFPIAVLLDLLLLSRRRAVWFVVCGAVAGVAAGLWNRHVGGPWFVQELLLGRLYSWGKARDVTISVLGPMLVPFVLACWAAWRMRHHPRRRLAALLLLVSVVVGGYFSGGRGVAGNALFTVLFAIVLLLGLLLSDTEAAPWNPLLAVVAFGWLITPALVQGIANPIANLRAAASAEQRYGQEVAFLKQQPGPALCESILRCLDAGKPYVYDPFNATRLIYQGRLSQAALIAEIDAHRYGVIQLHIPVPAAPDDMMRERFAEPVLRAIDRAYVLKLQDEDTAIYVPRVHSP